MKDEPGGGARAPGNDTFLASQTRTEIDVSERVEKVLRTMETPPRWWQVAALDSRPHERAIGAARICAAMDDDASGVVAASEPATVREEFGVLVYAVFSDRTCNQLDERDDFQSALDSAHAYREPEHPASVWSRVEPPWTLVRDLPADRIATDTTGAGQDEEAGRWAGSEA